MNERPILVYANEHLGTDAWPFDKSFSLILNVAVGGNWGGEVDTTAFPQSMAVDFGRVYRNRRHVNVWGAWLCAQFPKPEQ